MIVGQSGRAANAYLVDLGGGWATIYHDDLGYVENPGSLAALKGEDARWGPWQPVDDARSLSVASRLEATVGGMTPAGRVVMELQAA